MVVVLDQALKKKDHQLALGACDLRDIERRRAPAPPHASALPRGRVQVTLFKRNYHHVVSDAYFKAYHTVARGNPNYFITYGNGKSAARVQSGLRPNGAHRWYSYVKAPKCAPCFIERPACLRCKVRERHCEDVQSWGSLVVCIDKPKRTPPSTCPYSSIVGSAQSPEQGLWV